MQDSPRPAARILVVEDEPSSAIGVSAILRRAGHQVEIARDGAAALELVVRVQPHLMLLDLQLPVLSGLDVLERMGPVRPTIVAMTGSTDAATLNRLYQLGCRRILTKPFSPAELSSQIRSALRERGVP